MADNYEYSRAEMRRGDNPLNEETSWIWAASTDPKLKNTQEFKNKVAAKKKQYLEETAARYAAAKANKKEGGRRSRRGGRRTRRVTRRRTSRR